MFFCLLLTDKRLSRQNKTMWVTLPFPVPAHHGTSVLLHPETMLITGSVYDLADMVPYFQTDRAHSSSLFFRENSDGESWAENRFIFSTAPCWCLTHSCEFVETSRLHQVERHFFVDSAVLLGYSSLSQQGVGGWGWSGCGRLIGWCCWAQ